MAYAVRHRMIDFNPVRDAERPRHQGREDQEAEKQIAILTPVQIRVFPTSSKIRNIGPAF